MGRCRACDTPRPFLLAYRAGTTSAQNVLSDSEAIVITLPWPYRHPSRQWPETDRNQGDDPPPIPMDGREWYSRHRLCLLYMMVR